MILCRMCMQQTTKPVSICNSKVNGVSIRGMIKEHFTFMNLRPSDPIEATFLCEKCMLNIWSIHNFHERIKRIQKNLSLARFKTPNTKIIIKKLGGRPSPKASKDAILECSDIDMEYASKKGTNHFIKSTSGFEFVDLTESSLDKKSKNHMNELDEEPLDEIDLTRILDSEAPTVSTTKQVPDEIDLTRVSDEAPTISPMEQVSEYKSDDVDVEISKYFIQFSCFLCKINFRHFQEVLSHNTTNHNIKNIACCEKQFSNRNTFLKHLKEAHRDLNAKGKSKAAKPNQALAKISNLPPKTYSHSVITKLKNASPTSTSSAGLKTIMRIAKCKICNMRVKKSDITKHLSTHSEESRMTVQCNICNKRVMKQRINEHIKWHSGTTSASNIPATKIVIRRVHNSKQSDHKMNESTDGQCRQSIRVQ